MPYTKEGKFYDQSTFDHLYKVILLGDSGVGKSNLMSCFNRGEFAFDSKPTIGFEFAAKPVPIETDGKVILAQVWDTAGQERFRSVPRVHYRGALGALLIYDITNRESFKNVQVWLTELRQLADPEIVILLIGNKDDHLSEGRRAVSVKEGMTFAAKNGFWFFETSALAATNVEDAFGILLNRIYLDQRSKAIAADKALVKMDTTASQPKKRCC